MRMGDPRVIPTCDAFPDPATLRGAEEGHMAVPGGP